MLTGRCWRSEKITGARREVIPQTNRSWFRPVGEPKGHAAADGEWHVG